MRLSRLASFSNQSDSWDLAGDETGLPLEKADASGGNAGLLAGAIAAIAVGAVTLAGGAAWYKRRRWGS